MSFGASIVSLKTSDTRGTLANIVLGLDSVEAYLTGTSYVGATVGRFANRIAGGRFELDGEIYQLPANDGPNSLHGGPLGFDRQNWSTRGAATSAEGERIEFRNVSPDGEGGFPGQVTATVKYLLRNDIDSLEIEFRAETTAPTPVNLSNHAYFNLTGDATRRIDDHILMLNANRFTPVDSTLIPTGELRTVAGTPCDFRQPRVIGETEYDLNWVLNKPTPGGLSLAAVLEDRESGRIVEIQTTQPGVQFYTGNFLSDYRTGLCLETQHFPDSPNQPGFPSTILRPGEIYREKAILTFLTSS
jgi:aldose 1-epimerase